MAVDSITFGTVRSSDHRSAAGHRFNRRKWETLIPLRAQYDIALGVEPAQIVVTESSVKLVGSKFILRSENRMREAVNMPGDLVRIAPYELSHRRNRVLEAFPLFRAAIRHHSDDAVLGAQFWLQVEPVGVDPVLNHRDCFGKP